MIRCLREQPFYANILLGLKCIEDDSIETMATNGIELRYSPKFAIARPTEELALICIHEALHVVQGHHLRRKTLELFSEINGLVDGKQEEMDWKAWQQACDCEVNSLIQGLTNFPKEGTTATKLRLEENRLAEWYYEALKKQNPPQGGGQPPPQRQGQQGSQQGGQPGGQPPPQGQGQQKPQAGKPQGKDRGGMGDVLPHPKATGKDQEDAKLQQEHQATVTRAAMAAKEAGKLPGWMEQRLEEMLAPAQVNWRMLLRQFATETVKSGICWKRPSRRMHHVEGFMPARQSRTIGTVFLVEDTSGSMGEHWHKQVCAELTTIMQSFPQATIRVLQVDTVIALDRTFKSGEKVDTAFKTTVNGRGGTNMTPAFDLAKKERPQCIILLTDGYMSFPSNPAIPTLWLMTNKEVKPPFGRTVLLSD
jgi:predicted metal-dependent peptidase